MAKARDEADQPLDWVDRPAVEENAKKKAPQNPDADVSDHSAGEQGLSG